jgi:hypothetical protein
MDKTRWPLHLCEPEFTSQSTARWALSQLFASDNLKNLRWAAMWPLPIGKRALMENAEVADTPSWTEVAGVLPFMEYEQAMGAARVQYREQASVHTLDLFGLAEYPDELHKELASPVAGKLAFVVRAHGRRTIDLLNAAEGWWSQFRGQALPGRPKGSGTWANRKELEDWLRATVATLRSKGAKPTQENVAALLPTNARQLRSWLSDHRISWKEIVS